MTRVFLLMCDMYVLAKVFYIRCFTLPTAGGSAAVVSQHEFEGIYLTVTDILQYLPTICAPERAYHGPIPKHTSFY